MGWAYLLTICSCCLLRSLIKSTKLTHCIDIWVPFESKQNGIIRLSYMVLNITVKPFFMMLTLPNNNFFYLSKFKAPPDDNINVIRKLQVFYRRLKTL